MAHRVLDSTATSVFCGSVASMIGAGLQVDEALQLLSEERAPSRMQEACEATFDCVSDGLPLSEAMRRSGWFPTYATDMVEVGEQAGHIDETLGRLASYYGEETRIMTKLRESIGRPLVMLLLTTVILAVMAFAVMPVFDRTYANMSLVLAVDSSGSIALASRIVLVALGASIACALCASFLWVIAHAEDGHILLSRLLSVFPPTANAMYQAALSRFTATLATYIAAGATGEEAVHQAMGTLDNARLRRQVEQAYASMTSADDPRSLGQAIEESGMFEPLYARMLNVGIRSGRVDSILMEFSDIFRMDASMRLDRLADGVEPVLATLMVVSAGTAMVAMMLPLIGIISTMG